MKQLLDKAGWIPKNLFSTAIILVFSFYVTK